jgi:hypothetical protein
MQRKKFQQGLQKITITPRPTSLTYNPLQIIILT